MSPFWNRSARKERASTGDVREIMGAVYGNWDVLALEAWEGFEEQGRGYVLIDDRTGSYEYLPGLSRPVQKGPDSAWAQVLRMSAEYDPTTEIIVVFLNFARRGSVTPMRVVTPDGMLTPRETYDSADRIDEEEDLIASWGPMTDSEWRRVFRLLRERWLSTAASAGEGLKLAGRGCLGVDFDEKTTQYLPATRLSEAPDSELMREVRWMCHNYDPSSEMVLVISKVGLDRRQDACLLIRTPPGWATPPEAYQQFGVIKAT